ncbi:hypothetical protein ACWC4A_47370 [Streptomyces mirabilis]|uniref:hypothetical protein n=1 Tax=Streptomyces mirabilis TaxID=68239 RepID=UPI0035E04D5E
MARFSASFALPVDRVLADGTYLSHLSGPGRSRITVRVVEYTVTTAAVGWAGSASAVADLDQDGDQQPVGHQVRAAQGQAPQGLADERDQAGDAGQAEFPAER